MKQDIRSRYEQAQTLIQGHMTTRLVRNDSVFPHWIENSNCFWYKRDLAEGCEYRLVEARTGKNTAAFDHQKLADALSAASGKPVAAQTLPLTMVTISLAPTRIRFAAFGSFWQFDVDAGTLAAATPDTPDTELISPDGKLTAFRREHNLWVRNLATGKESQLTRDGAENYSYGRSSYFDMDPALQCRWSPDSRQLFTVAFDTRKVEPHVAQMHYVPNDGSLRPQLVPQVPRAVAGAEHIESYCLFIIDVATGDRVEPDYPALPYSHLGLAGTGFFSAERGWWSPEGVAYFIDLTRSAKALRVVRLNPTTGKTTVVIEETADTFVKVRHDVVAEWTLIRPLPETGELILFSERTDFGQLYLYDLATGKLKNPITKGDWVVRDILHLDEKRRELLILAGGRNPDISPYYREVCKVNIDSGELTPLASGNFDHQIHARKDVSLHLLMMYGIQSPGGDGVSPDGEYMIVSRSRVDTAPVTVLLDRQGEEIATLEDTDVSQLPVDWQWPEPVKVKAADGKTDIYGVVYRPPGFSPDQKYPVVEICTSSRTHAWGTQSSFINHPTSCGYEYYDAIATAALGFVVVSLECRGTPHRSKSFQDHHYGDDSYSNDFEDRIAGMRQLAERNPWMDLNRVGLTGFESSSNSAFASLSHSDFYKVVVVNCVSDPRFGLAAQDEPFNGNPNDFPDVKYAEDLVDTFGGKMFLLMGMLDSQVAPGFRLVEALQKANKDFDMLCLPRMNHNRPVYPMRRQWDYLVKHLQGIEPPKEFPLEDSFTLLESSLVG